MKLPFINECIFKPHKSPVEIRESSYIYSIEDYPSLACNISRKLKISRYIFNQIFKFQNFVI